MKGSYAFSGRTSFFNSQTSHLYISFVELAEGIPTPLQWNQWMSINSVKSMNDNLWMSTDPEIIGK